jgi:hypothetical protein
MTVGRGGQKEGGREGGGVPRAVRFGGGAKTRTGRKGQKAGPSAKDRIG